MPAHHPDLTARVEQIARELVDTRRELEQLRAERRTSRATVATLMVLGALSATWSASAKAVVIQPARVNAPFEVVDASGKAIFSVIESGAPTGGGVVVTGGDANGARHGLYVLNKSGARVVGLGQMETGDGSLLVRNSEGQPVFTVTNGAPAGSGLVVTGGEGGARQGLYVLNRAGASVVSLGQAEGGYGAILVRDQDAKTRMRLDGTGTLSVEDAAGKGIFRVSEKLSPTSARVSIGASETGHYSLRLSGPSGTQLVTLGEAKVGGGVALAYNAAGEIGAVVSGTGQIHAADAGVIRVAMVAEKGQGSFSVRNASGTTVARFGEGTGGGLLQIANSGGNAMVEAGIHPSGVGLVRAFPVRSPGAGMVGMPGTFLIGRPGGQ